MGRRRNRRFLRLLPFGPEVVYYNDHESAAQVLHGWYPEMERILQCRPAGNALYACGHAYAGQPVLVSEYGGSCFTVPFPVSWTVKMKKKQKETQDILSYHTQAAGCSDKARAKASGGRQPIEECGRTGL